MKSRWTSFLAALSVTVCCASAALAQQPAPAVPPPSTPAPAVAPSTPAPAPATPAEPTPAAKAAAAPPAAAPAPVAAPADTAADLAALAKEPGEWEYKDADLQTVLSTLALRAQVNLIVGDGVAGRVTVLLRGLTAREAMQVIAESKGYVIREEKNLVKVLTRDAAETMPTFTRVYTLSYAKASEIMGIVQPSLTKQGRVVVDPRSNSLVLTDTEPSLEKMKLLLAALDTQTPQVQIEAKFIETTKVVGKGLGVDWSDTLTTHPIQFGSPPPKPEDKGVVPMTWTKGLRPGTPWSLSTAMLDFGQAQVVLSFMSNDSDTELLASPRVVTMDNIKAKVAIANQIAIPQIEFNETTGSYQSKGFEWKEIGVILNVTPRVNKDGFITLEVAPEVSSPAGSSSIAGVTVPTISTRTASTVVLIKSGNTLLIGGLIRDDVSDQYTKVPVMGDIPGLGTLFRSKSLSKMKRNLLVFLTPQLISPEAKVNEAAAIAPLKEEIYTNDKWMPQDNAKPRPIDSIHDLFEAPARPTPRANFSPK